MAAKTERMLWGPAAVNFDDGGKRTTRFDEVDLPHDYIISQTPSGENNASLGYFKYDNAWYRKHFTIPAEDEGKRLTLYFEAVATHATVYLNGSLMKRNFCGYTSFEVDITDVVRYGEDNVLAVYVEAESHEGWWYEGAGIHRHVWLIKTSPVAVDLWGVYVRPEKQGETAWKVSLETTVRNDRYAPAEVEVTTRILDRDENVIGTAVCRGTIGMRSVCTLSSEVQIDTPHLWDVDDPYLYTAHTVIRENGVEVDITNDRFGFRWYHIDPDRGFFLNGKPLKIKGVCAHADCGLLGKAVPDNIYRHKIAMLREMGANGYRTSHYPHAEATMDALDEMGFIVMDEIRWLESTDEGKAQLDMLIKRDRNRPSVFFWSIGNEELITTTPAGRRIAASLTAYARQLDDTRIVTYADSHPTNSETFDLMDVIGINYSLDAYENIRAQYPDKTIVASECCAVSTTRGWFEENSEVHGYMSAYDKTGPYFWKAREETWKFLCSKEWILGGYQWDSFEHRGESQWPRLCSQAGAIDLFFQRKDAFYQNQSHWLE
ncbi:MAG: beta galactosidase jelly roll domain-containing protein, partial [Clostridia bacterium]|nr:beta galactosidase jelly roll domain-containing protein [Clostridia bacterium]